jgi:hypothetical protein
MRKHLIISAATLAATLTLALAGASYAAASTTDTLTYGSQAGTNIPVNSVISDSLQSGTPATFYTSTSGTTGGTCSAGSYSATVTSNPAEGTVSDETTTSQSFGDCTDNLSFSINSITIKPYDATMGGNGTQIASLKSTLVGTNSAGATVTCHYTGTSVSGSWVFTNQELTLGSGSSGACVSTLYFSATYGALIDTSVSGDPIVYVNT